MFTAPSPLPSALASSSQAPNCGYVEAAAAAVVGDVTVVSGRGALGRPFPWAYAVGVTPRVTTIMNAPATRRPVRIERFTLGLRRAGGRGAGGRRRRRGRLRTKLTNGLPQAETVHRHRLLQICECDALVL